MINLSQARLKPLLASGLLLATILAIPTSGMACGMCQPTVDTANSESSAKTSSINQYLSDMFDQNFNDNGLKGWWNDFWDDTMEPSLKAMADQLSATAIYQTYVIGTFFDAKAQLETQQSLQKIRARAHKDYQPSTGMCQFGSAAKSLAASDLKGELNALTLQRRAQDRQLGNVSAISAMGGSADLKSRINQFKSTYCDPADNDGQLDQMCRNSDGTLGGSDANRLNKDIDFTRAIDSPWTLPVDFSDTNVADGEVDVSALANNLYGHDISAVTPALTDAHISGSSTGRKGRLDSARKSELARAYLQARSLLAKRSVAENSFNAIVALKSEGSEGAKDYLSAIMQDLGISDTAQVDAILGDKPSYYAQMEVLTKKLYQNPEFYTNLYDKPANVRRKEVALQAVGLMQKFDLFKSSLRSEASLAVLLEMAVADEQGRIEGTER